MIWRRAFDKTDMEGRNKRPLLMKAVFWPDMDIKKILTRRKET